MAASLDPRIIVLALGAGALGFPDALRALLDTAGRSPLADIALCVFAIAVVTAQALGAILLARFVRKAGDARAPPRTDPFAQLTLAVSLGAAFLVSACLLVASGADARGQLCLVAAYVAGKMESPVVIAALATGAAVLFCTRPLLRVFRRVEEHSYGAAGAAAAAGSSSAWMDRFANVAQVASLTGAAAFLLAVSGVLYIRVALTVGVVALVGTMLLLARFAFTRQPRNAAGAGGRAAPAPAADRRRFGVKLTRLAPYLAVASFAVICLVLTSLTDGAKDP